MNGLHSASSISRRRLLQLGCGMLGCSLPELFALQARGALDGKRARAKNVLVILEQGGLSQMDTWDPKPNVVAEHRSHFKPIATKVPGMRFTELLTQTSRVADKLSVVRSMWHPKGGANGHGEGTRYMLSGSHPSSPMEMPDIGSVATHLLGTRSTFLPPYIMVPGNHEQSNETRTGFLPPSTKVFKTGGRDLSAKDWKVGALEPRPDTPEKRLIDRKGLLASMNNQYLASAGTGKSYGGMERFYDQAFDTLTSPKVAAAFNYQGEPDGIREKYGKGHRGACYLVGRKLIEAGVRFVTVDVRWPLTNDTPGGFNLNWDHHDNIYANGSCGTIRDKAGGEGRYGIGHWVMMGSTDQAFAALIEDMDQRGLLAETLVCFVTEFGRTPKLNKFQGRDHWTNAYSCAFAGAGVPGGQVIGATDKEAGQVANEPHTPEEYAATIYEKLGIDRTKPLYTSSNRPVFLGNDVEPIGPLF
ncbi:MAG: DUF1501 domain-containing protein [Planctomycetes bacterium]|nr:DUF1501 domain-containing protein [Planctomycetota bacterium]